jgi:hypothetical protein
LGRSLLLEHLINSGEAAQVASHLVDTAQYDLANDLFECFEPGRLTYRERVMYASSYSETPPG